MKESKSFKKYGKTYNSLFKNNHAIMLLIDPENGMIVDANYAAISFYGYSKEELIQRNIKDINILNEKTVSSLMQKAISEEERHFIFKHRLANGEIKDVDVYSGPVIIENRKLLYSIIHDISFQKKAEETAIKNKERFELLSDAASLLLSSETPEKIVETICKKVMNYLDCQVFFNYLLDDEMHLLHLNAYTGVSEETRRSIEWLDLGIAVCGCVAREGCPIIVEKIQETLDERTELIKSFGVKAYACHPIISKGQTIGTLSFGTKSRSQFNEDELELMRTITNYVATAMERKIKENAIIQAKNDWENTFDTVPDLIAILDHQHRVVRVNKAMADRLGLTPAECVSLPCYRAVHGSNKPPSFCPHSQLLEDGLEHTTEVNEDILGGHFIVSVSPLNNLDGKLIGSVHVARDITERKKAEEQKHQLLEQVQEFAEELEASNEELRATSEELQVANEELRDQGEHLVRLNKTLRALSHSSHAMIHATNEDEYLDEICKIIIEDCNHAMVWIGYAEDDENKTVRPVAYYGFDEGYIENLNITWADTELGRGPTGTAIRTGKPSICRNMLTNPNFEPWREEAIKRGYASSLVVPLIADDKKLGSISIYSSEPDSFLDDEVKLLAELANDLAFGITNLRLRAENERTQKELRESEHKMRTLFEISPVGISIIDKNRNVVYENPALERILDLSLTDLKQKNHEKRKYIRSNGTIIPHVEIPSVKALKENRIIENVEIGIIKEDKSIIWTNVSATPLSFSDWNVLITTSDITERKKAEASLRESEKLMSMTQEIAHLGSWELDIINNDLYWSDEVYRIFGLKPQEFGATYEAFLEAIHPEDRKAVDDAYIISLREGKDSYEIEHRVVRKSTGEVRIVHEKCEHIRDESGQIIRSIGMVHDITERKRIEQELAESEERYRLILETANSGVFLLDSENRIKYLNQRTMELLGYSAQEMLDISLTEFLDTKEQKNINKFLSRWRKGLKGLNEFKFIRKDGSSFWTLLAASPIVDNNSRYIGTIGVITDINARKGVEKALIERERISKSILYDMIGMINKLMKEESKNEYSDVFESKYEYN
ncbi:PAS domain S-box protein [Methanobacterium oryzae]|uniref:PAS domain S-box protein n=1 Tax=Methanobacterium oryzae TaxID=69540 RepID=UPI003D1D55FB